MTTIEWTDETWNPTRGCTPVSPGCKNCYAKRFAERFRGVIGHPYEMGFDPRFVPDALEKPLHWKTPRRIFVNSMSDLFHPDFSQTQRAAVFGVMAACPQHTFQLLTKYISNMEWWFKWIAKQAHAQGPSEPVICGIHAANYGADVDYLGLPDIWPLPNLILLVSTEIQKMADIRIPRLLRIPAAARGISAEPLLGALDVQKYLERCHAARDGECSAKSCPQRRDREPETSGRHCPLDDWDAHEHELPPRIDWVIAGGESGPGARLSDLAWHRSLREQCHAAGVPFFEKQTGAIVRYDPRTDCSAWPKGRWHDDKDLVRPRDRSGGDPSEWPEDLRIREFPKLGANKCK